MNFSLVFQTCYDTMTHTSSRVVDVFFEWASRASVERDGALETLASRDGWTKGSPNWRRVAFILFDAGRLNSKLGHPEKDSMLIDRLATQLDGL